MAETRERSCYTCFHRPACAGMMEAQGLADYVNLGPQSSGRCPDYIFSGDVSRVRHGRLGLPYTDEYYGLFADCKECGTDNILPCNYCRVCGAKMDLEVPENETL